MSNYQRLISYIYAYEGGIKGKNIGFAKLDTRGSQCRIMVSVKRIYVGGNPIGVYLLTGEEEIRLGTLFARNGAGEFRAVVNVQNVENSGHSLEECFGLTVHDTESAWRCYTTIWEDAVTRAAELDLQEVTAEQVRRTEQKKNVEVITEKEPAPAEALPISKEIEEEVEKEELKELGILRIRENSPAAGEIAETGAALAMEEAAETGAALATERAAEPESASIAEETVEEIAETDPGLAAEEIAETGTDPAPEETSQPVTAFEAAPVLKEEPEPQRPHEIQESQEPQAFQEPQESREPQESSESQPSREKPLATFIPSPHRREEEQNSEAEMWEMLRGRYPKILAFDYEDGCEILTIKPQDIGLLPRENWVYGSNSFLLHGYYYYRYLILARLNQPGDRGRYLLGVPGHYMSNEKYMAAMFGFKDFVLSKKQPPKDSRFGYWYTDIKIN